MLGAAVADRLAADGHEVRTLQRSSTGRADEVTGSITDPRAVARAVDGRDAVVHLAAKVSVTGDETGFRRVNVAGTRSLLAAARRAGATRFVQVSSPSVAHTGHALVGAGAEPADPLRARGPYARTKAAGELAALAADAPGFAVVAVRPHLVWGPGDTQLVARVVDRARRGRLPLLGRGTALVDTVYRDNAADAIAAALERAPEVHGRAYVVSNGEPRPIGDLIGAMCRAAGVPAPERRVPAGLARAAGAAAEAWWSIRPGDDEPPMTRFLAEQLSTAHWFDQRVTRRDLAWEPAVGLDEGFARLADWYARQR
jgi:2-alkyl-3-oxoalkanoate reductase